MSETKIELPGWSRPGFMQSARLCGQLQREIVRGHELHGVQVLDAVLSRDSNDDVLFRVDQADTPWVMVHLSWSRNRDPAYPAFSAYPDLDAFRQAEEELQAMLAADSDGGENNETAIARENPPCPACGQAARREHQGLENDWYACDACGRTFGIDWSGEQG